jgi:hypothetical protein
VARPLGRAGLAILALLPIARAAQYPDYQPLAAREYPSYQEQQGIGLAVVPLFDKSSQKRYLGANLLAQGFLAVYVVIENHASTRGAILLRDQMTFRHDASPPVSRANNQPRPGASNAVAAMAAAPPGGIGEGVIGAVAVSIAVHGLSDVRVNLLKKELRSQTVAPGKVGSGFVFVPTGKGGKPAAEVSMDVPIKGGPSDEDIHFYFRIDMRSNK